MPQPPQRNIFGIDAGLMIGVAQIFDFLQLGGKIGYPIAMTVAGLTAWIPFFGQLIGSASLSAAGIFDVGMSIPIAIGGYFSMYMWFAMKRESVFSGEFIEKKLMAMIICFTISCVPVLNALPDITIWTIVNIIFAQHQYKDKLMKYNKWVEVKQQELFARRQAYREELLSNT